MGMSAFASIVDALSNVARPEGCTLASMVMSTDRGDTAGITVSGACTGEVFVGYLQALTALAQSQGHVLAWTQPIAAYATPEASHTARGDLLLNAAQTPPAAPPPTPEPAPVPPEVVP